MNDNSSDSDSEKTQRGEVTENWRAFGSPTVAIVQATAAAMGREPTELPPLQMYVDADALDTLLAEESNGDGITIVFDYDRVRVRIESDGSLIVDPGTISS